MNKDQAIAAQRFLSRVDLKGSEVIAFVEIMNALQDIITPPASNGPTNVGNKEVEETTIGNQA